MLLFGLFELDDRTGPLQPSRISTEVGMLLLREEPR